MLIKAILVYKLMLLFFTCLFLNVLLLFILLWSLYGFSITLHCMPQCCQHICQQRSWISPLSHHSVFNFHQIFKSLQNVSWLNLNKCTGSLKQFIQGFYLSKILLCSMEVWYTSTYLKVLAEFMILNGSTASTHSFGVAFMRSQRATSKGVESIQSTNAP